MTLRVSWAIWPALGILAPLCACGPADHPAMERRAMPIPAMEYGAETPRHYGTSTAPRTIRHRTIEKRHRQRREVQQADAEWVNPPLGAGE